VPFCGLQSWSFGRAHEIYSDIHAAHLVNGRYVDTHRRKTNQKEFYYDIHAAHLVNGRYADTHRRKTISAEVIAAYVFEIETRVVVCSVFSAIVISCCLFSAVVTAIIISWSVTAIIISWSHVTFWFWGEHCWLPPSCCTGCRTRCPCRGCCATHAL